MATLKAFFVFKSCFDFHTYANKKCVCVLQKIKCALGTPQLLLVRLKTGGFFGVQHTPTFRFDTTGGKSALAYTPTFF